MEVYDIQATAINAALQAALSYAAEHGVTHIHIRQQPSCHQDSA